MNTRNSAAHVLWVGAALLLLACAGPGVKQASAPSGPAAAPAVSDSSIYAQSRQAEQDGSRLYAAFKAPGAEPEPAEVANARAAVKDFCDYDYKPVFVADARPGVDYVYFIGTGSSDDILVWGRHYRVEVEKATGKIVSVAPSTKSCLAMSLTAGLPPGAKLVSPSITHLLSPSPSEFHVFLSLKLDMPVTVATSYGLWSVEAGKIRLLDKR